MHEISYFTVKGRQKEFQLVYLATMTKDANKEVHLEIMEVKDEEKKQKNPNLQESLRVLF